MPILSKTSYLIFIVSNFLGTVHGVLPEAGFIYSQSTAPFCRAVFLCL